MRPWMILAALALARAGFGYQFQTVATLGPDLVPLFHLNYADLGKLIGAYMLLGVFIALPLGVLGRRLGDRLVLCSGLACMAAGAGVSAWAGGPDGIAAGRIISGGGAVAMIVLQNKVISDWFTGRRFILAISISVCAYPIGVGGAQLILPPLAQAYGWPAAFLSGGVLRDPGIAAVSAELPAVGANRRDSAAFLPAQQAGMPAAGGGWADVDVLHHRLSRLYLLCPVHAVAARAKAWRVIGLVMTIATWGNVPATLFGGGLAARYGGFQHFPDRHGRPGRRHARHRAESDRRCSGRSSVGIVGSVHPGVIIAVGTLSARPENRAVGLGLFYTLYYAGGTLAPALCGHAADVYGGPAGALLAAAGSAVLALPLYLLHRQLATHEALLAGR